MRLNKLLAVGLAGGIGCVLPVALTAQPVEKVVDLNTGTVGDLPYGGVMPMDRVTQVGTNLWFTTERGGQYDAGTLSRFDLVTREVVQVASLGTSVTNNLGERPEGSVLVVGDEAYFTTKGGGTGDQGAIIRVNLLTGVPTNLYSFPQNTAAIRNSGLQTGSTPRGGLTRIGDDLWCLTSTGGVSNRGTVVKFNLNTYTTTLVTNFDGPVLGGQPYGNFVKAGNAYYFNTFTGGSTFGTVSSFQYTLSDGTPVNTTTSLPLGGGTLSRLTFDGFGNPVFTRLIDLPGGFAQFPNSDPIPVGTNSLYFPTVGPNSWPGSMVRYDLDTGYWTNVFCFPTNASYSTNFGTRPGYNGFAEWQNELYFINRLGGVSNLGTVVKFNIASNTVTKLADLTAVHPASLGNSGNGYNVGAVVEETNRFFMYFPTSRGGANGPIGFTSGLGTLLRIPLPAPPIHLAINHSAPDEVTLNWSGGYEPFSVQTRGDLGGGAWTNLFEGITNRFVTLSNLTDRAFFRIGGS